MRHAIITKREGARHCCPELETEGKKVEFRCNFVCYLRFVVISPECNYI